MYLKYIFGNFFLIASARWLKYFHITKHSSQKKYYVAAVNIILMVIGVRNFKVGNMLVIHTSSVPSVYGLQ